MRFRSFCSGIEAASVAWKPLGWSCESVAEIDPFACAVLKHHHPEAENLGNLETIRDCGTADVFVAGTPCQSFSVAGLRGGMADARGNLALVFLRLVGRARPRWVVWENVPGVLSSGGGRDFGSFLGGLGELGYGFAYRVLDAQYFGVPQRRRRVFVVAHLGDWRRAGAVLFERQSLCGHPAPGRESGEGVAGSLSARASAGGGLGTEFDCAGGLVPEVSPALKARDYKGPSSDGDGDGAPLIPVAFDMAQITSKANRTRVGSGLPASTLNTAGQMHVAHALRGEGHDASEDGTGRGTPLVPAVFDPKGGGKQTTLGLSNHSTGVLGTTKTPGLMGTMGVRRLTPRECERLQGFPDDYTLVPYRGKPASDGPRYRALGNSMAVPCMKWLAERIALVDG